MSAKSSYTLREQIALIRRGLSIYKSFPKPVLLSAALTAVFDAVVPFINLYFSARILNELVGERNHDSLQILVLLTVCLNLTALLLQTALLRWKTYCHSCNWNELFRTYSAKALSLDYADLENPKIQDDYSQIRQHQMGMGFGLSRLAWPIPEIVKGLFQIAFSITFAFTLFTLKVPESSPYTWLDSWWMVSTVILVLAGPVFLTPYLNMLGGKIWARATHDNNKGNRFFFFYFFRMIHNSDTAKDIRIYNQKRLIREQQISEEGGFNIHRWQQYSKYNAKFAAGGTAVTYLCNGLIYLYIAAKALTGAFEVGSIVLYVGAFTQFGMGFSSILSNLAYLINNNPFLEKAFKFLDIANPMYQGSLTTEKRSDNEYEIEFRNVSFKYPSADDFALKHVSLKFKVGERLAIVGENGSGKTTFIKLLCRLHDPTEGVILLNGIDIRKYSYKDYIAIFSIVFQDFKLLPFTLGQNVAASIDYDKERVRQALEQCGFAEQLASWSKGLDTYLYKNFEDEGVEVSGGEAQKIALARALYKEAPFVILDEPTAALDPIAEFDVYSKMNEIVGDKTAVFISHRLSSCRFCNDIAVFHEGELIQRGSHDDLLSHGSGKYSELWNAQAQYYVEQKIKN